MEMIQHFLTPPAFSLPRQSSRRLYVAKRFIRMEWKRTVSPLQGDMFFHTGVEQTRVCKCFVKKVITKMRGSILASSVHYLKFIEEILNLHSNGIEDKLLFIKPFPDITFFPSRSIV